MLNTKNISLLQFNNEKISMSPKSNFSTPTECVPKKNI